MYRHATSRRVRRGWGQRHPTHSKAERGGAAFGSAVAVRKVPLTKDQVRAVRRDKMAERAAEQRDRLTGYTRSQDYEHGERRLWATRMEGVPAWMDRRTGQPHERKRERRGGR